MKWKILVKQEQGISLLSLVWNVLLVIPLLMTTTINIRYPVVIYLFLLLSSLFLLNQSINVTGPNSRKPLINSREKILHFRQVQMEKVKKSLYLAWVSYISRYMLNVSEEKVIQKWNQDNLLSTIEKPFPIKPLSIIYIRNNQEEQDNMLE